MVEEEKLKSYSEIVNRPNGYLRERAVDKKLNSLDRGETWKVVDKVVGEKEVSRK
jgi:hypothetical protein